MRVGINALYLIPGGVGGTEIYLWSLLEALNRVDSANEYVLYINRETTAENLRFGPRVRVAHCGIRARNRPLRILWEQLIFPFVILRDHIDVLFNPGFTMPLLLVIPSVTVFHDLQHKRHPQFFRWFDLPVWRFLLWGPPDVPEN